MCFDRNINENKDVKFLECDYLLVQRCVKLTLEVGKGPSLYYVIKWAWWVGLEIKWSVLLYLC